MQTLPRLHTVVHPVFSFSYEIKQRNKTKKLLARNSKSEKGKVQVPDPRFTRSDHTLAFTTEIFHLSANSRTQSTRGNKAAPFIFVVKKRARGKKFTFVYTRARTMKNFTAASHADPLDFHSAFADRSLHGTLFNVYTQT